MGQYFLIEDFKSGLDRRRMNVTAPSGTLVRAENVNISRGGEIEKRERFRKFCDLPNNTFGLVATPTGFYVFGSTDISGTYPNNVLNSNPPVRYQRLQAGGADMVRVHSITLFDAKPYVIAEYDDGTIHHFYDGTEVTDWYSAKARFKFTITGGSADEATAATGSFKISDGFTGDDVTAITVDGSPIISGSVDFAAGYTLEDFIEAIKNAINAYSGTSGYSATRSGNKITLTSLTLGAGWNGDAISVTATGSLTVHDIVDIGGGTDASKITDITIDGNPIIDTEIDWAGSNSQTADAVAVAIKAYSGTSGFTAQAFGQEVVIMATSDGTTVNGDAVAITATGGVTVTPDTGVMAGGATGPSKLEPGRFAKTVKTKVYALSTSLMHYSAIDDPTKFESGTGFGFENLSTNAAGSENLTALANYFDDLAVFSKNNVQVWFVDPDPDQNAQLQVLNNTGAIAPNSVVEFGDNDVFYLSESGIRSLRARDSSNAAFVNDVGIQIDDIIQAKILEDSIIASEAQGVLEPREGRYLLAIGSTVYVFSFFPSSKVSAWTTYELPFTVKWWAYSGQLVACRSENAIYQLGSVAGKVYDGSEATVIVPFLDAGTPANAKAWVGIDAAAEGTWKVYAALDINQPDEFIEIGSLQGSTFNNMDMPAIGNSTHISLKFVSEDADGAKLGSVAIHYILGEAA